MRDRVVVVAGPTAVGKTAVGIAIAKRLNGEIINGDAFQIYRGLDIGTAKVCPEASGGVPHHLIDIRNPDESYSVKDYQRDARRQIAAIASRGRLPIIVGGTGLYIKAAVYDYRFDELGPDPMIRKQLEMIGAKEGIAALHRRLEAIDPASAAQIHPHNAKRVIRALEVYLRTGQPFSRRQKRTGLYPTFALALFGLSMSRDRLYERINSRVNRMMDRGLLEEVRTLYRRGYRDSQALQAIGYKEFFPYFENKCSLEAAVERLKMNSRHYAKRQMTWFKRQMNLEWFDASADCLVDDLVDRIRMLFY